MKNFIGVLMFLSFSVCLCAQNNTNDKDIDQLNTEIKSLKAANAKLKTMLTESIKIQEKKLNEFNGNLNSAECKVASQTDSLKQIYNSFNKLNKLDKNKFIYQNILDLDKMIIIGIWDNPNKLNILSNQGIMINNDQKIYGLLYGIISSIQIIVLIFENNIKLVISKNEFGELFLVLTENKNEYKKQISNDIINNLIKINNKSPDLDLIFLLLNKN